MKILINVEGGIVQNVLIETAPNEWVKTDNLTVGVWDNDTDLSTGDALGLIMLDPIVVDSIVQESPTLSAKLADNGF